VAFSSKTRSFTSETEVHNIYYLAVRFNWSYMPGAGIHILVVGL
jgi:hypothetical protein